MQLLQKNHYILLIFCLILPLINLEAQTNSNISSLEEQVSTASPTDKPTLYIKLANLYLTTDLKKALTNAELARTFAKKTKRVEAEAEASNILGVIYSKRNDPTNALKYYEEELELRDKQPASKQLSQLYYQVATLYRSLNKTKKACDLYEKNLEIAIKAGDTKLIPSLYEALFSMYYDRGKYKEALGYFKSYMVIKDSLSKQDSKRELSQYETKAHEKDKLIGKLNTITDQQKQEILNQELEISNKRVLLSEKELEISKRNSERRFLIVILSFITLFILLLMALYLSIMRANKKLTAQYLQIQDQKEEIETQRDDIEEKRSIIEQINIEITQSIEYALKIQQVIMPSLDEIKSAFPESFVLYRPKDIVSGDFYWVTPIINNRLFIAAADCTGHGVPGAFMSMIGMEKLNEIISKTELLPNLHPAAILSLLDQKIKKTLRQDFPDATSMNDGLDIALCEFNFSNGEVIFSGANRPLWLWKAADSTMVEYPPVKRCIGSIYPSDFEFKDNIVDIATNDMMYIFSDGYADQFGGDQKRKLMKRNFKKVLNSIYQQSPSQQCEYLNRFYDEWKGTEGQLDDVLIIGIRYSFNE